MPKKVEEMVKAIKKTGKSESAAWAIATANYAKMKKHKKDKK